MHTQSTTLLESSAGLAYYHACFTLGLILEVHVHSWLQHMFWLSFSCGFWPYLKGKAFHPQSNGSYHEARASWADTSFPSALNLRAP